jgi:N-acetylneuraminate synthase
MSHHSASQVPRIRINGREYGPGQPCYVVAEMSANHRQDFDEAVRIIRAIRETGADAVKIQTYTADTLTLKSASRYFRIAGGTLWDGKTLHDLYQEAYLPWDWTPKLQAVAQEEGLDFFSTPFDFTAVDFLEKLKVPVHKVASFELVDIPLIQRIAATGKPIIASTGMATVAEIGEAVRAARQAGARQLALLKCTSAYPAQPGQMNLRTMVDMATRFQVPVGLSDHTLGIAVPVAAVALGACIVEKHFTLSRSLPGPDSAFSLEPLEFKAMVEAIRVAEQALGKADYTISAREAKSRVFRRSLFVSQPVRKGEKFTAANVQSVRPAHGLHPRYYRVVLGKRAARNIPAATPLSWKLVAGGMPKAAARAKERA